MKVIRRKHPGSRWLLAFALVVGTLASAGAGAWIADLTLDLAAVESRPVRIVVKALSMAAALPAGFYLVERAFLERSRAISRRTPAP